MSVSTLVDVGKFSHANYLAVTICP
jgi:hypothetical protein